MFLVFHGITAVALLKGLAAAVGLGALGTLVTVPHPQPLIPASSPDQDTIVAQAENLRAQFEVISGTTDVIQGGGGSLNSLPNSPATPVTGRSLITSAGANATTLATPLAGDPAAGGNDGLAIEIINVSGQAHTVTTAANKINTNKQVATFPATKGTRIVLTAYNGIWYTDGGGTTLT
jgi:hypothetical protein